MNTIVLTRPKRAARRVATWKDTDWSRPRTKKTTPSTSSEVPKVSVNQYAMNACVTKPAAERVEREERGQPLDDAA